MMCGENWKNGIILFANLIEEAFSKSSLPKRIEYIYKLLDLRSTTINDILKISKIITFVEWLFNYKP